MTHDSERPAERREPRVPAERRRARMAPLARLPLFVDLAGRRAVVAGGTDDAAWKAELLAAAGAAVEVFAADIGHEMAGLAEDGASAGSIALTRRAWRPEDLAGTAIAVADLGEAEAARFFTAARAAGVPVNVIDRPRWCSVQVGSIVNRSPVVIGISTAGAAPVLGQEIRARIEAVLPASLAGWAAAARAIRAGVSARLAAGAPRLRFWHRFARRAFEEAPPDAVARLMETLDAEELGPDEAGRVTLVGAGPGAADLLTVRAIRALQAADVILFDDLVDDAVLELGRREARRIAVGKRAGRASCLQADINALLVRLAREGQRVVRLKCGDPTVFGRAGEEIAALRAAGIAVTVVPGITAASAAAATLGASLTHRDVARSVTSLTGFTRDHRIPDGTSPDGVDWAALAGRAGTLAVYMGGRVAGGIARRLLLAGRAPDTPVVVAEAVSHPDERFTAMTLRDLVTWHPAGGRPVLLLIGEAMVAAGRHAAAVTEKDEGLRSAVGSP